MATIQKIVANLWFAREAEAAAKFYTSIFKDACIGRTAYYTTEGFEQHGMPAGSVMTIEFTLAGQQFLALNGGPHFRFSEAISFVIYCDDQRELDHYWEKLGEGGDAAARQCGWLKDKYGLSWQVVPAALPEMVAAPEPDRSARVVRALMKMKKLDIATLEQAYNEQT